jgi:hypothetical protein
MALCAVNFATTEANWTGVSKVTVKLVEVSSPRVTPEFKVVNELPVGVISKVVEVPLKIANALDPVFA